MLRSKLNEAITHWRQQFPYNHPTVTFDVQVKASDVAASKYARMFRSNRSNVGLSTERIRFRLFRQTSIYKNSASNSVCFKAALIIKDLKALSPIIAPLMVAATHVSPADCPSNDVTLAYCKHSHYFHKFIFMGDTGYQILKAQTEFWETDPACRKALCQ